ncbi:MAG: hypothetical protein H7Z75_02045 [Ferruginibacter sp.]|nr:hypothetical protein [Cytophagales bacterium]
MPPRKWTEEIGIRKVFGASVANLLLLKGFLRLVSLANRLAGVDREAAIIGHNMVGKYYFSRADEPLLLRMTGLTA